MTGGDRMSTDQAQPEAPAIGHWRGTLLVGLIVLGGYLLLLNPYWTPGGDSEVFICAARSILRGEGNTYNGKPVYVAPPLWSYVMAGAMWIWPTFLMLKIVSVALMTAACLLAHRVMLRLAPARWAHWAAIMGGLLVPVYSLTFWLHSEPLFCALSWGAALMAVRAVEDRRRTLEVFGIIVLCALMAAARWTAGLQWGIVAALLLAGCYCRESRWKSEEGGAQGSVPGYGPRAGTLYLDKRISAGLGASALVTILLFLLFYIVIPQVADAVTPGPPTATIPPTTQDAEDAPPSIVDNTVFKDLSPAEERVARLVAAGHWPAWTLWYPARFASGVSGLMWMSQGIGWLVILMLSIAGWRALAARGEVAAWPLGRWLWPALVGYLFVLVVIWPLPNARYLVPVAPLLILGVLWGCTGLAEFLRAPRMGRPLRGVFVASLVAVNGAVYVTELWIQRSGDRLLGGSGQIYYKNYEAALHVSLLRSIQYLREQEAADLEVAVSERYSNLNRMRFSKAGPRNVVMLLDREVIAPPPHYSFVPSEIPDKLFRQERVLPGGFPEWARIQGVKYYLFQQPMEPWRVWHFRLSSRLQSELTGLPPEPPTFGWILYSAHDDFQHPVELPQSFEPPRRVPGL